MARDGNTPQRLAAVAEPVQLLDSGEVFEIELMAWHGWRTISEAQRYVNEAKPNLAGRECRGEDHCERHLEFGRLFGEFISFLAARGCR
jgi:hypothetical protein